MATNTVKVTLQIRHDEAADGLLEIPYLLLASTGLSLILFY